MKVDSLDAQLVSINNRKQALERRIESRQLKLLLALPAEAGMADMDILIVALMPLSSTTLRQRFMPAGFDDAGYSTPIALTASKAVNGNGRANGHANGSSNGHATARRAHFASDLKSRIKAELRAGKKSVATLSREYGPSHPTIMSWKRGWGMTQPRARK